MPKVAQRSLFSEPVATEGEPSRKRAAGYIRVSTQGQAEEGLGLQVQREAIEAYCAGQGLELVRIYEDAGVSGSNVFEDRPGWVELTLGLSADEFKIVVVLRLDRFSRNARDQANMLYDLERSGVRVLSVKEPEGGEEDETRKFMRTILAGFAEYEKDKLVARLAAGRRLKRTNGGYSGGWHPMGYELEGEGCSARLVVNEAEAEVVRAIFEAVAHGETFNAVAARLQARGVATKRGGLWGAGTVKAIVCNPFYIGQGNDGRPKNHPSIVDEKTWRLAQR